MNDRTTLKQIAIPVDIMEGLRHIAQREFRSVSKQILKVLRETVETDRRSNPVHTVEEPKRPVGRPANKPKAGEESWRDDPELRLERFKRYILSFPPGQRAGITSVPDDWEDTEA